MNTDVQICIETICNFPMLYKTVNKTPVDIVTDSGYYEVSEAVTVQSIAIYLLSRQDIIDEWIQFSEDIRHSPAWGIGSDNNDSWKVSYSDNGQIITSFTFDNKIDACAKMIKETIEQLNKRNDLGAVANT